MATSDLEGLDPAGAKTPEAFMQLLRQARTASGLSLVEIADRARKRGYELDPVGLARALEQPALPSWQVVTGLLAACGLVGMKIDRWMRVYHDLAEPAAPVFAAAPVAAPVEEPDDVEPVSVPPLVLTTTAEDRPARIRPRHLAIAAGVVVALVLAPLLAFGMFNGGPEGVAAAPTSKPPRTIIAAPPPPSPTDLPVELSPTPTAAAPTTAAPARTTPPPPRTTAPPPPPPPSPTPPTSPADPGVFRTGTASLTGNGTLDFDGGGSDIFRWNGTTLAGTNNARRLEPVSGQPSKQTCNTLPDWDRTVEDLQAGQWLCVRTNENRLGRINITATGDTIKLSYTIWNY